MKSCSRIDFLLFGIFLFLFVDVLFLQQVYHNSWDNVREIPRMKVPFDTSFSIISFSIFPWEERCRWAGRREAEGLDHTFRPAPEANDSFPRTFGKRGARTLEM